MVNTLKMLDLEDGAYGWIVTEDLLEGTSVEILGPAEIDPALVDELRAGKGRAFRILDDDRIPYYRGRLLGGDGFEPLDDFGAPGDGATIIQYRTPAGWTDL